jgi:hypothetical protein
VIGIRKLLATWLLAALLRVWPDRNPAGLVSIMALAQAMAEDAMAEGGK